MENVLRAERDGTVKKIHAKPGDSLAVDAVITNFGSFVRLRVTFRMRDNMMSQTVP